MINFFLRILRESLQGSRVRDCRQARSSAGSGGGRRGREGVRNRIGSLLGKQRWKEGPTYRIPGPLIRLFGREKVKGERK